MDDKLDCSPYIQEALDRIRAAEQNKLIEPERNKKEVIERNILTAIRSML